MLRKEDVELVRELRALHTREPKKPMSNRERQQYSRIRDRIEETLNGLTSLLENLPETQLTLTFTEKKKNVRLIKSFMRHFFDVVLSLEGDDKKKRIQRVKIFWGALLIREAGYAPNLVGRDIWRAITGQMDSLRALYYAASEEQEAET